MKLDHIQVDMKQVEFVLYARAAALKLFFVNKVDPDQAALVCLWGYEMSDHSQVELICSCGSLKLFC